MEYKEINEEFFEKEKDSFISCMIERFGKLNLSNMNKNVLNIKVYEYDNMKTPAKYMGDCNELVYSIKNIEKYGFSDDELRHMFFHELIHMSSTKRKGNILTIAKTGWGSGSAFFPKLFAITEGMTDYLAEVATGKRVNVGYLFEKRCAESICEIFGDSVAQSFFNANINEFFKHAKNLGIKKREIQQLFNKMDKSLIWRYKSLDKVPEEKNEYIYQIEKDLIDIAVKVSRNKGYTKEQISDKITKIQSRFIPSELKHEHISKEEKFLSKYSENLDKAYKYAEQQKIKLLYPQKSDISQAHYDTVKDFKESLESNVKAEEEQQKDSIIDKSQNNLEYKDMELRDY